MNSIKRWASYVLIVGMIVPTFSSAMNPIRAVAQTATQAATSVKNTINNYVDVSFHFGIKSVHNNPEVKAIKDEVIITGNRPHQDMYNQLRRDSAPFRALVEHSELVRQSIHVLEQIQTAFDANPNQPTTINQALVSVPQAVHNNVRQEIARVAPTLNNAAAQLTRVAHMQAVIAALNILDVREAETEQQINLYFKLYQLYGFEKFDVDQNGNAIHQGPLAKNNAMCTRMITAMNVPAGDVLIFPTVAAAGNRPHGLIKGVLYPVNSTCVKKIILINVAAFNQLTSTQKADRVSHVLAQFAHEESQWALFKHDSRETILYWAKKMPYIIAACGIVYYYTHASTPLPHIPTTLADLYQVGTQAGSWISSFWSTPAQVASVSYYDQVVALLARVGVFSSAQAADPTFVEKLQTIIVSVYGDLAQRTPYALKTIGLAVASSWVIKQIGQKWHGMMSTWDSYRADALVCQKRAQPGYVGVFERMGQEVANGNGGMARLCYLWIQKKLGLI